MNNSNMGSLSRALVSFSNRSLRTSGNLIPLKDLKNADGFYYKNDMIKMLKSRGINTSLRHDGSLGMIARAKTDKWTQEEFFKLVNTLPPRNRDLFERAANDDLAVVDWPKFTQELTSMFEATKKCNVDQIGERNGVFKGSNGHKEDCFIPDYIPQLARVNKDILAMSVCTVDGQRFHLGDYDTWYTMQSTSKPFFYSIAHALLGDRLHNHVGHEPSGRAFNEICLDNYNRPFNPMINMGAIMTTALIKPDMILADRFDFIRNIMKEFTAGRHVFCDMAIYKSELEVGYGNKAAINFMMNNGCFPDQMTDSKLADVLDLYYQLCSLEVTVKTQSIMGACLANGGVNPLNFKRIIPEMSNVRTLSLMFSSGMYDYSGKFAFNYGVPAKSGVSGATMIVIPNVLAITLYNPWLGKESASSVRALEFIQRFNQKYPFHMFETSKSFSHNRELDATSSLTFFN